MPELALHQAFIQTMHRFRKTTFNLPDMGITRGTFVALSLLVDAEMQGEAGLYVSQLAEQLHVSSPAVSRLLGSMEKQGLIQRAVHPQSRRNTTVTLTPQGRQSHQVIHTALEAQAQAFTQQMGEADMAQLLTLWNRLTDIMQAKEGNS